VGPCGLRQGHKRRAAQHTQVRGPGVQGGRVVECVSSMGWGRGAGAACGARQAGHKHGGAQYTQVTGPGVHTWVLDAHGWGGVGWSRVGACGARQAGHERGGAQHTQVRGPGVLCVDMMGLRCGCLQLTHVLAPWEAVRATTAPAGAVLLSWGMLDCHGQTIPKTKLLRRAMQATATQWLPLRQAQHRTPHLLPLSHLLQPPQVC
jgi:hypothetical protein